MFKYFNYTLCVLLLSSLVSIQTLAASNNMGNFESKYRNLFTNSYFLEGDELEQEMRRVQETYFNESNDIYGKISKNEINKMVTDIKKGFSISVEKQRSSKNAPHIKKLIRHLYLICSRNAFSSQELYATCTNIDLKNKLENLYNNIAAFDELVLITEDTLNLLDFIGEMQFTQQEKECEINDLTQNKINDIALDIEKIIEAL